MKNINWSNELTIKESWVQINNKSSTMSYFVIGYKNEDGSEITVWEGEKVTIEDENGNEKIGKKLGIEQSKVLDDYNYLVEWCRDDINYQFLARKEIDCVHIVRSIMYDGSLKSVIRGNLVNIV